MNNFNQPPQSTHSNPAKYKTSLCKHFQSQKGCSFGEKCQFAHGINELRTQPGVNPFMNQMRTQTKKGTNSQNYKIVKCKYFERDGTCRYGTLCSFAHGESELRKKSDNIMNTPDRMMEPMPMFFNQGYMPPQFDQNMMMRGIPNMPNMPNLLNMLNMPNMPNMMNMPNMSNMSNMPDMSNMPNMMNMPNMSNMPNMPNMPDNEMMKSLNMFMMQNQMDPMEMINKPENQPQKDQKEGNSEGDDNKDK